MISARAIMNAGVLPAAAVTADENLSKKVGFFIADCFINLFFFPDYNFQTSVDGNSLCCLDGQASRLVNSKREL